MNLSKIKQGCIYPWILMSQDHNVL